MEQGAEKGGWEIEQVEGGEGQGIDGGVKWRRECEKQGGVDLLAPMFYRKMRLYVVIMTL